MANNPDRYTEKEIKKGARIYLVRSIIAPFLLAALYFVAAGSIQNLHAWIYFILFFLLSVSTNIIFYIKQPEMIFHRNKFKSDAKGWDKIIMPVAVFSGFHIQSIVMGLDARFKWSHFERFPWILGLVIYLISFFITVWAMYMNKHFEANVRIQQDRDHRVITEGPYRLVRHPGYLAFILATFSIPIIVGSVFGLINAIISSVLILIRTAMEDRTLKLELDGYKDYAYKVRFRILPGIWL